MPALNLASASKTEAIKVAVEQTKKADSLKNRFDRMKEKGAEVGENIMGSTLTIGAGAGAGLLAAKYPGQWMSVDKEVWIGLGAIVLGLTGLGGPKMSGAMLSIGNGFGAVWAYNALKNRA